MRPTGIVQTYFFLILLILGSAPAWATTANSEKSITLTHGAIGLDKLSNVENGKIVGGFKYDLIEEIGRRLGWSK
ncbi:hypothetical protein [Pseudomaricurvus sp.]|uniref:hypothetical protein n=1 Tax=Pseudomaricurvus sp. TaxID=2004510 RepID=UPI003F6B9209